MFRKTRDLAMSEHFTLQPVADGAYAAIAILGGAAFGNAGIIDLGDQTIIFDTCETPRAAEDLRQAAERLTGRPTAYVINSHAHPDHWFGNQVFGDHATIIATHAARERMSFFEDDVKECQEDPSELEDILGEEIKQLEAATDAREREFLEGSVSRLEFYIEALPILQLRFPHLTFDGKLVFYGSQRTAELHTLGPGHTAGDCFLVLPDQKLTFLGDLAFFQRQPFMPDCDPAAWMAQLEDLERSDIETFVPGHGPVGTKADVTLEKQYITALEALVTQAVQDGTPLEETLERPLPSPFDALSRDGKPLEANVRFYYGRLSG